MSTLRYKRMRNNKCCLFNPMNSYLLLWFFFIIKSPHTNFNEYNRIKLGFTGPSKTCSCEIFYQINVLYEIKRFYFSRTKMYVMSFSCLNQTKTHEKNFTFRSFYFA